jgi:Ca-activated chloride channel family protein
MPTHPVRFLVLAAALIATPRFAPPDTGRIAGHVRDAGGTPLANAHILVIGTRLTAVTNPSGAYLIGSVPAGTYLLRAQLVGYSPAAVHGVRVAAGQTVTVDVVLQPAPVSLNEVVVSGAPVAADRLATRAERRRVMAYAERDDEPWRVRREPWNTEEYGRINENPFLAVSAHPLSTFSIDVDRASYSNVRRMLLEGQAPPKDAVRIEELVNYFPYGYAEPRDDDPVAIHTEIAQAPWKPAHRLLRIGLQARRIDTRGLPPSNLVFLIDVSGSMDEPNKLPLLKASLGLLVNTLRPQDRVAIVVYAGSAGLVLPSTPGDQKPAILQAIEQLEAGGSTAGGAGIKRAYDEAVANFIRGGNNRVILATDGDFNVGVSSDGELVRLIEEKRKTGVFLTVLGFGQGNLKDAKMEQLADHGNGNYAYIDNLLEARKTLVHELGGTLFTVAKDVKIQVEFNPAHVRAYRLIGYENRLLAAEDFADDTKDAGEIGSGHSVTALYEIIPVGVETDVTVRTPDSLRYQRGRPRSDTEAGPELLFVKVRYKQPDGERSRLLTHAVLDTPSRAATADFQFQTAVAEFGLLLRQSEHRGAASLRHVIEVARGAVGTDPDGYRAEFVRLAQAAQSLGLAQADAPR